MEWVYAATALASAVAAMLAWMAKLWWSREFAAAKDEIIKAKDAQIEALNSQLEAIRDMSPMKLREYFQSVKGQLEEYNDFLSSQLEDAKGEIDEMSIQIVALQEEGDKKSSNMMKLKEERDQLVATSSKLEKQRNELQTRYNFLSTHGGIFPPEGSRDLWERLEETSSDLGKQLGAESGRKNLKDVESEHRKRPSPNPLLLDNLPLMFLVLGWVAMFSSASLFGREDIE